MGRRLVWGLWVGSALLGAVAPVLRASTHQRWVERWPIGLAVLGMLVFMLVNRRRAGVFHHSMTGSIAGIASGAGFGFLLVGLWFGHSADFLFAAKWVVGGFLLTALMVRQLRREDEMAEFEARQAEWVASLKTMSPEEKNAAVEAQMLEGRKMIAEAEAFMAKMKSEERKALWVGAAAMGLVLVVAAIYYLGHR